MCVHVYADLMFPWKLSCCSCMSSAEKHELSIFNISFCVNSYSCNLICVCTLCCVCRSAHIHLRVQSLIERKKIQFQCLLMWCTYAFHTEYHAVCLLHVQSRPTRALCNYVCAFNSASQSLPQWHNDKDFSDCTMNKSTGKKDIKTLFPHLYLYYSIEDGTANMKKVQVEC